MSMLDSPVEMETTAVTAADWLSGYELRGVIGSGGCGTVYEARHVPLDRIVAVKLITADPDRPEAIARFEAEAITLGRLQHPNIVQVFDAGRVPNRIYIAMELLSGEDAARRLLSGRPFDERTAWGIARQAAAALAHAAAHGISHRDVKPANLFLCAPPTGLHWPADLPLVKVLDFGLAKHPVAKNREPQTAHGMLIGTPAYMAPEQFQAPEKSDLRTDIYGLGATVLHLLTGRPPFAGRTIWEVMEKKLKGMPALPPGVSPKSAALIAEMLAPLEHRIGSYEELIPRIDELAALPEPDSAAPRKIRYWAIGAVASLIVGASLAGWARSGHGKPGSGIPPRRTPDTAALRTVGDLQLLFDGTLNGWQAGAGPCSIELDEDSSPVMSFMGTRRRPFESLEECRITIGVDLHKATALEICIGAANDRSSRPAFRIERSGVQLGTRDGDPGVFHPHGPPVPYPPPSWFQERGGRPYLEVKLERGNRFWKAAFNGRDAGTLDASALPTVSEVQLVSENGRARIDSVVLGTFAIP